MANFLLARNRFAPVVSLAALIILISFITRLVLLFSFSGNMHVKPGDIFVAFFIGLLFDLASAIFILIPLTMLIGFSNNFIYTKKGKWLAFAFFATVLYVLFFTAFIPRDFNKDLYTGLIGYIILRLLIFVFLIFAGARWRTRWRVFILNLLLSIIIFCLLLNAVSEWFFWDEFSARYNFIAVDYLVYTNEVLGNINESYPVFWLFGGVAAITVFVMVIIKKLVRHSVTAKSAFGRRVMIALLICMLAVPAIFFIDPEWKNFSRNNYANELAGNGMFDFVQAFKNNELDFYKYYETISNEEAFMLVRKQLSATNTTFTGIDSFSIERDIVSGLPENKMNVVLISVESLSASFMTEFGNTKGITPNLDSLAKKGMFFTNMYASGTRTVRGLEALSLCIPPTPGQSLVKRPANEKLFSLGHVFRTKGYNTEFIYGGYGYFDNMNYFFANNEYDVVDRSTLGPADIHYANIWGVADEDLFALALRNLDSLDAVHKPFFTQIMTVSNHKPYTYPDNRIEIPSSLHGRDGAVKYTDYAIGDFIKKASGKSWSKNTVFVIVADHCASSAGSTALPVTGYHIPLIIYAPGFIQPQKVTTLAAQIDVGPTILGLLHFNYRSKFFGQDILNTAVEKQRVFISTYQGLGFIQNGQFVLQSPVKQVHTFLPDFYTGENMPVKGNTEIIRSAIAHYQVAAWLIKHKKYTAD